MFVVDMNETELTIAFGELSIIFWINGRQRHARTYRDIAIEDMLGTVQEAMSQVVGWWGDLPPEMKEAIERFRIELGAAIDFRRIC